MSNPRCLEEQNNSIDISISLPQCDQTDYQPIFCYSFYKLVDFNSSQNLIFQAKGCGGNDINLCKNRLFNNDLLYCCCQGSFCNKNLDPDICLLDAKQKIIIESLTKTFFAEFLYKSTENYYFILLIFLLILIPFCVLIQRIFFKKFFQKKIIDNEKNKNKELEKLLSNHDLIEIDEFKAKGRYGDVYKGKLLNRKNENMVLIAIKIFQFSEKESFKNELKIYSLPDLKHENILKFIKAEIHSSKITSSLEFWLLTEYKKNGSLTEFLKVNLLDLNQIFKISSDISNGLAFLHGYGFRNQQIAHRDFKSSNILLDENNRACIADFGLALVFYNHKLESDTLNQVGTPRYMAPELLDRAIHFSGDSILKVDVYACALVFWELLSRCNMFEQENNYQLPFEKELGSFPTIEKLRVYVSIQKQRPIIEKSWKLNSSLELFCKTINDCWHHDSECRITASNVTERLKKIRKDFDFQLSEHKFC